MSSLCVYIYLADGSNISYEPTCIAFSIMTVHTEIAETNLSEFCVQCGDVILLHSKFSLFLHGNWTTN